MGESMAHKLSAVICTYQRYDYLDTAIKSLLEQDSKASVFEILIIDNSPDNPARAASAKKYADNNRVRYLTVDRAGLANARNVAAAQSKAEIIAFLDDDAIAEPGWVSAIISGFNAHPEATIGGGPIDPIYEIPRPNWLNDRLAVYLTAIDWGPRIRFLDANEWVAGANIAYRREAYLAAGGCNTSLGRTGAGNSLLSNEETELSDRLKARGGKVLYVPNARVQHFVPASRINREWFRRRAMWQAISDQMIGDLTPAERTAYAENLLPYIASVPPAERSLRAFYYDVDDAEQFWWQVQAIYSYYRLTLSSGTLFPEVA